MAVSKKGLRKVNFHGRQYLWTVREIQEEIPETGFVQPVSERYLHIISANKAFIVRYRIPKPGDEFTYLFVDGRDFPGIQGCELRVGADRLNSGSAPAGSPPDRRAPDTPTGAPA